MTRVLAMGLALFSLSAWALDRLPDGTWMGTGQYKTEAGERGTYTSHIQIHGNVIIGTGEMNGKKMSHQATVVFSREGFLTATSEDGKTSTGYCEGSWCHIDNAERTYEMSFGWEGNEMYTMGSVLRDGKRIVFSEKLMKQ